MSEDKTGLSRKLRDIESSNETLDEHIDYLDEMVAITPPQYRDNIFSSKWWAEFDKFKPPRLKLKEDRGKDE